jgi:plasmid stabilization system protein ParE
VASIEAKFKPLRHSPLIGSPREQFGAGLRVVFKTPYAVYYLARAHDLIIIRVLHSARDATAIADQRGFIV